MCDVHSLGYDILDPGPSDVRVSVDGDLHLQLQLQLQLHGSLQTAGIDPQPGSLAAAACSAVHAASGPAGFPTALQAASRSEVWPALCAEAYLARVARFGAFASPEQAASWADACEWVEALLGRNEKSPAQSPDTSPPASNL